MNQQLDDIKAMLQQSIEVINTLLCKKIRCIACHSTNVIKYGACEKGFQRYLCHNEACPCTTFQLPKS